ncbi:sigma-70 family RNA polymerase sigma factor [Jeotgalibacillus aurantiacus]|uniref:sigma-70 family RNA polymerase sigma factor n=1 Tax=Jeotgalibacillus aurantiacus TaxID=2763266 RepID=UPI001D0B83A3|nr:sigma-70 family RNA polymerase sigma factor [Jeotgalibacillus aurantiacus]
MTKKEIENLIYKYHWQSKEASRLASLIFGRTGGSEKSWGVAQYGLEAVMPKGSSIRSARELEEMDKREERLYKRYMKFNEHVETLERIAAEVESFSDERMAIIIDCMMEGMSYRSIAMHLGINRNLIRELKDDMLCQICQKCHFVHDLKLEEKLI